mgnify:CR=1 FL=1
MNETKNNHTDSASDTAPLTENTGELILPVVPLRGVVAFPDVQITVEIARSASLKAFAAAATSEDAKLLLVAQKDVAVEEPTPRDLYSVGVLAVICAPMRRKTAILSPMRPSGKKKSRALPSFSIL